MHLKIKFLDNTQAEHINLHVGDNVAPSGRGDVPPERNDPNVAIPAAGKVIVIFRLRNLFGWRPVFPISAKKCEIFSGIFALKFCEFRRFFSRQKPAFLFPAKNLRQPRFTYGASLWYVAEIAEKKLLFFFFF